MVKYFFKLPAKFSKFFVGDLRRYFLKLTRKSKNWTLSNLDKLSLKYLTTN